MKLPGEHYTSGRITERSGRYRAFLSYVDASGKRCQVSKTLAARGKAEANRELKAWWSEMENQAELDAKRGPTATGIAKQLVPDYLDAFITSLEERAAVEASTIKSYRNTAKYIREAFPNVTVEGLNPEQVKNWEAGLTKAGYSSSTVGKCHRLLKQAMKDAVNMRALDFNPVDPVKPPKRTKVRKGINALDADGRTRVLAALDGMELSPVTVAARIALYTGLREGEICGLQWGDLDEAASVLWVRRAIGEAEGGCYEKSTKTDKVRDVALPPTLTEVLGDWRRAQRVAFAEAGATLEPSSYVVGDPVGFANPRTLGRKWAMLAELLGVLGTEGRVPTFHDLRHTWATMYIAAGGDVKTAASNLGHSNVAMTLNVYASADKDAKRAAAELTEQAMTSNPAEVARAKARRAGSESLAEVLRFTGTEG